MVFKVPSNPFWLSISWWNAYKITDALMENQFFLKEDWKIILFFLMQRFWNVKSNAPHPDNLFIFLGKSCFAGSCVFSSSNEDHFHTSVTTWQWVVWEVSTLKLICCVRAVRVPIAVALTQDRAQPWFHSRGSERALLWDCISSPALSGSGYVH